MSFQYRISSRRKKDQSAVSSLGCEVWKKLNHNSQWTVHDLRRTFATKLNDIGVAPHVVEQLLGHAMPGVMGIYNRSQYLPEKLDALNRWMDRLDILAKNTHLSPPGIKNQSDEKIFSTFFVQALMRLETSGSIRRHQIKYQVRVIHKIAPLPPIYFSR
ncbi:hypothetical protein SODG_001125 [Sodalis praecaptivus]